MKIIVSFMFFLLLPCSLLAEAENPMYDFFTGTYIAVGKHPESGKTYTGRVTCTAMGTYLKVTRVIDGKTVVGTGRIKNVDVGEGTILLVNFTQEGKEYQIAYLFSSDLDNYPRLSGYVYPLGRETKDPGLEVLFIDHTSKQ